MNTTKSYEDLELRDDFIFAKAMRNPKLCRQLLELILDVTIDRIEYPEEQKVIDITMDARGVRLDVYVKDGKNTVYNIEMQTTNPKNLPKRSRYYQGMIDLNLIEKGENYNRLNKSYVIFICMSDLFGRGRHLYTFRNICLQDKTLLLEDETTKVFLNPNGTMEDIGTELKNFLIFLSQGTALDQFTRELEKEVEKVRNNEEWRREFMTLLMRDNEKKEEGRREGRQEGALQTLVILVKDGLISVQEAAKRADMNELDFKKLI